jgi:hypothetical protein
MKRSRLEDAIFSDDDDDEEQQDNSKGQRQQQQPQQQKPQGKEQGKGGGKDEIKDSNSEKKGEELLIKKRKVRRQVNESDLAGDDGILRIYEEFPRHCQFHGRGYEVSEREMNKYSAKDILIIAFVLSLLCPSVPLFLCPSVSLSLLFPPSTGA